MPKKIINPPDLAPPRGFNHGILASQGEILFLAGQDASDPQGRVVAQGDIVGQFEQALRNLQAVLLAAGGAPDDVVKLNIFVRDRRSYRASLEPLGRAYRQVFGKHYPAMALFEVNGFFQEEALIEIEGMAVIENEL